MVVKSGSDFKEFSTITLYFEVSPEEAKSASDQLYKENSEGFSCTYNKKTSIFTEVKHMKIYSKMYEPDQDVLKHVKICADNFGAGMDK
jgi:hypothetical protein